jgi:hypothetical protein
VGRKLRRSSIVSSPEIPFPDPNLPYVVPWLRRLAHVAATNTPGSACSTTPMTKWPEGHQAAFAITHDVDTDWIFKHPEWLDRICRLEERYGLRGAWYCVPRNSSHRQAEFAMQALRDRGCELGCHGYNHDAKLPLLKGPAFQKRLETIQRFRDRWQMRGFRSEWLFRTPEFLTAIGACFDYDSSIPAVNPLFSSRSFNGCGTCHPFQTHGGLWELPLSIPMDEDRHLLPQDEASFWATLAVRSEQVIECGGLIVMTLHPQPHQMANEKVLRQVEMVLERIATREDLWLARPDEVVDWLQNKSQ